MAALECPAEGRERPGLELSSDHLIPLERGREGMVREVFLEEVAF